MLSTSITLSIGCGTIEKAVLSSRPESVIHTNSATGEISTNQYLFFSAKQGFTDRVQDGQAIASAIPGYGTLVSGALGLLLSGVTLLAKRKTEQQLKTVIRGVESAAESGTVKASIAKEASIAGVFDSLHAAVKQFTK